MGDVIRLKNLAQNPPGARAGEDLGEPGLLGSPGQVNYAASKSALIGMARSLTRELGGRNITVERRQPDPERRRGVRSYSGQLRKIRAEKTSRSPKNAAVRKTPGEEPDDNSRDQDQKPFPRRF